MKKVLYCSLFIFVTGVLASCATSTSTASYPAPYGFSTFLDYSSLTSKGIYVTESNSVSFDYKTLGSVSAIEIGGWVKKGKEPKKSIPREPNKNSEDELYTRINKNQYTEKNVYVDPSLDMAMDRMANTLKEVGANGIINLKVQSESGRIIISGMAIRK